MAECSVVPKQLPTASCYSLILGEETGSEPFFMDALFSLAQCTAKSENNGFVMS